MTKYTKINITLIFCLSKNLSRLQETKLQILTELTYQLLRFPLEKLAFATSLMAMVFSSFFCRLYPSLSQFPGTERFSRELLAFEKDGWEPQVLGLILDQAT